MYANTSLHLVSVTSEVGYGLCENCIVLMLTGTELLDKVKEVGDISKTDLARACGYVITKKDGSE